MSDFDKVPKRAGNGNLTGGSRKGIPNKTTGQLKEMILQALDKAGGVDYLLSCAHDEKSRNAFLTLVGKVLPMTVAGDPSSPLQHSIEVTFVKSRNDAAA